MKTFQKTILITACAVIFAGGCAFNRQSNSTPVKQVGDGAKLNVQEVASTSTEKEISASERKIYRNEELGFEIYIPSIWTEPQVSYYGDGSVLWEDKNDPVGLSIERLIIHDQEYKEQKLLFLKDDEQIELNGLKGYQKKHMYTRSGAKPDEQVSVSYVDELWLINGDIFYLIKPGMYHQDLTDEQIDKWKEIISTFKTFESMAVDPDGVAILRDDSLKLEMQVPNSWMVADADNDEDSIHFVSKWRDPIFEINTINLSVTRGLNFDLFKKEHESSLDGYNVYETFNQLNLDARDHFDIRPSFADYSGQDRPSFWGDGVRILVKDGDGYYEIWEMSTGSTKEQVEKYDRELKKFLETIRKIE